MFAVCISVYLTWDVFLFTESIRKIVDKSSIKFIRGIKLDTKNGKSEDRILVSTVLSEELRLVKTTFAILMRWLRGGWYSHRSLLIY